MPRHVKIKSNTKTNLWKTLTTLERREAQHTIRMNWNTKSAMRPFLGVDVVHIGKGRNDMQTQSGRLLQMTQEQYATLWLQSSLELRRVNKSDE